VLLFVIHISFHEAIESERGLHLTFDVAGAL